MVGAIAARLEQHKERKALLDEALHGMVGDGGDKGGSFVQKEAPVMPSGGLIAEIRKTGIFAVLQNSATGFASVAIFFMDMVRRAAPRRERFRIASG